MLSFKATPQIQNIKPTKTERQQCNIECLSQRECQYSEHRQAIKLWTRTVCSAAKALPLKKGREINLEGMSKASLL